MSITSRDFGAVRGGKAVTAYTIRNAAGAALTLLDYGATVQSLLIPNSLGDYTDVVLGYDTATEYEQNDSYLGATIGRVGNRIGGGVFSLNGKQYTLAKNDGKNHLHGGIKGFDKVMWTAKPQGDTLTFSYLSPNGEEGYPGNLTVTVRYVLTAENALKITYDADTDTDTLVNLTNHSYFNLSGGGTIYDHVLQVNAERFCENDAGCLPTGRLLCVDDTPFDFRMPKPIGLDIEADDEQLCRGKGYDHNFVLCGKEAAVLASPKTGIRMAVQTDMPGMQVYAAGGLTNRAGKGGRDIVRYGAVCLETQLFPNALNCYGFPSPVLRAGCHLHSETTYAFTIEQSGLA